MTINVGYFHIREGQVMEGSSCPLALAIQEEPDVDDAYVSSTEVSIRFNGETDWHTYELPKNAETFVERFDDDLDVSPFSFQLS